MKVFYLNVFHRFNLTVSKHLLFLTIADFYMFQQNSTLQSKYFNFMKKRENEGIHTYKIKLFVISPSWVTENF